MSAAIGVAKSANQKVGPVRVTHRSQASCPTDCPFRASGCYAEQGLQGMVTRRLNRSTETDPVVIARENAAAIDRLPTGAVPLRIDIVGDDTTAEGARITGAAAARYRVRGGGPVWKYTHSWRAIPRNAWGPALSILASCETTDHVKDAHARGYAAALVVDGF